MKVNKKPMMLHGIAELTQGRERERGREGDTVVRGEERHRGVSGVSISQRFARIAP